MISLLCIPLRLHQVVKLAEQMGAKAKKDNPQASKRKASKTERKQALQTLELCHELHSEIRVCYSSHCAQTSTQT